MTWSQASFSLQLKHSQAEQSQAELNEEDGVAVCRAQDNAGLQDPSSQVQQQHPLHTAAVSLTMHRLDAGHWKRKPCPPLLGSLFPNIPLPNVSPSKVVYKHRTSLHLVFCSHGLPVFLSNHLAPPQHSEGIWDLQ